MGRKLFQFGMIIGITPRLGFDPALTLLIATGMTLSRKKGDSRVDNDSSTSGANKRKAQISCSSCGSLMMDAGSIPPAHGRKRGKEIE